MLKNIIFFVVFFFQLNVHAIQIKCFEDEGNPKPRVVFLASMDHSPRVITFEQTFASPHPKEGMGYSFQQIKQSQSSGYHFPRGVYTGVSIIFNGEKEETYRGTLAIEEQGEWEFVNYKYQYRGTYLLHGPNDVATGVDKSVIIPVNCRGEGFVNP
ncbi:MAG: hypothetical protein V4596_02795 [Bdellovibrionota bacterium]